MVVPHYMTQNTLGTLETTWMRRGEILPHVTASLYSFLLATHVR